MLHDSWLRFRHLSFCLGISNGRCPKFHLSSKCLPMLGEMIDLMIRILRNMGSLFTWMGCVVYAQRWKLTTNLYLNWIFFNDLLLANRCTSISNVSLAVFLFGKRTYKIRQPEGNIMLEVVRCSWVLLSLIIHSLSVHLLLHSMIVRLYIACRSSEDQIEQGGKTWPLARFRIGQIR